MQSSAPAPSPARPSPAPAPSPAERAPRGVVIVIAGVDAGGCERRFANLYRHLAGVDDAAVPWECTFLVDAAMAARVPSLQVTPRNGRVRLETFGVSAGRERLGRRTRAAVRWMNLAAGAAALARILRRRPDHVVHFTNPLAMQCWPLVKGRDVVISFVAAGHPERKLRLRAFRELLGRGAKADCLSEDLARQLRAYPGYGGVRTFTSPGSFVDAEPFAAPREKRPLVTFAGRLNAIKGVRLLIEALPGLLAVDPALRVRVLGRGPMEEELRRAVAALDQPERVEVTYAVEIAPHLLESMVFLSLQEKENYPSQSLLEAMLAENAVVATDVGLTRLLVDESTGFRIAGADELVEAVSTLWRDPALRARCGAAARRRVLEEHSVEGFVAYLGQVYAHGRVPSAGGVG